MQPQTGPLNPPAVIVAGPTASGKTGLAAALAETLGGVVINADSMQVYRDLKVLTARPDAATMARAPHRLFGCLPAAERCSAGRWVGLAASEIAAARSAGRLPVLVGGTGLYLRALTEGLVEVPPIPEEARAAATALHRRLGGVAFHAALGDRDPEMGARLVPGDTQRLIRAWEVLEGTGRSLADWQRERPCRAVEGAFRTVVLMPPRTALYAACDGRFERMLDEGALEEARAVGALGLDPGLPAMKALGLRPLLALTRGELSRAEAVRLAQRDTRRYAKRQATWFRNQVIGDLRIEAQLTDSDIKNWVIKIRQTVLT